MANPSLVNTPTNLANANPLLFTRANLSLRRIAQSRKWLLVLPWIGFAWQCLLSSTSEDVICAALAASGAFIVLVDAFLPERFYRTTSLL